MENIWILITAALYNDENKKKKTKKGKESRKKPLNPKRVIYDSSFKCLKFSIKYFGDGKNTFPITINAQEEASCGSRYLCLPDSNSIKISLTSAGY